MSTAIGNPTARRLFELYAGREAVFAEALVTGSNGDRKVEYRPVRRPLTIEDVEHHLGGRVVLGVYPIRSDSRCLFGAIDVDAEEDADLGLTKVETLRRAAIQLGFPESAMLATFSGKKGHHLDLFFSEAIAAGTVRLLLEAIVLEAGFGSEDFELFPKQDSVDPEIPTSLGNLIKIPLAVHPLTGRKAEIVIRPSSGHVVPAAPAVVFDILAGRPESNRANELGEHTPRGPAEDTYTKGHRTKRIEQLAGICNAEGLSLGAAELACLDENQDYCAPPIPAAKVRETVQGIYRRYPDQHRQGPLARGGMVGSIAEAEPTPQTSELPAFPLEQLPAVAAEYAWALNQGGLPLPYLGPAVLAALAAAVGGLVALEVRAGSWVEYPVLWVLLVGRRGTKKSPSLDNIRRPFDEISARWSANFALDMEAWEGLPKADQKRTPRPVHNRLRADDTTQEALVRTLAANPAGVILASDEARALIAGLGQYKRQTTGDRARFLSLWTSAPLSVDRVGAGHIFVPRPVVTIAATIQPELLSVLDGPDGMRDRWLISCYEGGPIALADLSSVARERAGWHKLIADLVAQRGNERCLRFTTDAAALFLGIQRGYTALQAGGETPDHVEGWLAKAPSQLARIALTLAVVGGADQVGIAHLESAEQVVAYFIGQIRGLSVTGENLMLPRYARDQDLAVDALAAFTRRPPDKRVTRRDISRAHVGGSRTPAEVDVLIQRYRETFPGCVLEETAGGSKTLAVYAPGHQPTGETA